VSGGSNRTAFTALDLVCGLVIVALVLFAYAALLDRHGFESHEHDWPYLRAHEYLAELRAGHFPQTFPDAVSGGGYAFPRYYPPFGYAVAVLLAAALGDAMLGVHLALLLSVLLSGLACYYLIRTLVDDRAIALTSALLYVSFPYRFVDVFVRGALAESWTFVWYPLILAGIWQTLRRGSAPWYLPLAVAALLLSHTVLALYFCCLCLFFGLMVFRSEPPRRLAAVLVSVVLGGGLALWFLLPQQYYLHDVWASNRPRMWTTVDFVHGQRVFLSQLLHADSRHWFGGSTLYLPDDGMSFSLGWVQLAIVPAGALYVWQVTRGKAGVDPAVGSVALAASTAWVCGIAFMLVPGIPLLVLPAAFSYIQFPWRLLGLEAFLASIALGIFLTSVARTPARRWACAVAAAAAVALVPSYQRSKRTQPGWTREALTDSTLFVLGGRGYTKVAEYLPLGTDSAAANPAVRAAPSLSGGAAIRSWRKEGSRISAVVESPGISRMVFPLLYYDFYRVTDFNRSLASGEDRGLLAVTIGPGVHELEVGRRFTRPMLVGWTLSLVSAFLLLGIGARRRRWR
jgi:hypothetical protein